MIEIKRTNSDDSNFRNLLVHLDLHLQVLDGEDHSFYAQYNKLDHIKHVLVAYENNVSVGCGALKEFSNNIVEIKRMFVMPTSRGRRIASNILLELEAWARELKFERCILETGIQQEDAIKLYKKNGYQRVKNYDQYEGVEKSLCFEKIVK